MKIVLASSSPRRREILSRYVDDFTIMTPDVDEEESSASPALLCIDNAKLKARAVENECGNRLIIACDTIVVLDGKIYGKPRDFEDGVKILTALCGKEHTVYSGVCVKNDLREVCFTEKSAVKLKKMTEEEIVGYIKAYSPLDKAGCYGIQDFTVVEGYSGDYDNIVGLPVSRVMETLKEFGYVEGKSNN